MELIGYLVEKETAFLLVLTRILAFMSALPWMGGRGVPMKIKVLMALGMAFVLFPVVGVLTVPTTLSDWVIGLSGEVLMGLVIGLGVRLLFAAVDIGAEVAGFQMGFSIANAFNPTPLQEALIPRFQGLMAMLLFFSTDAHHDVIRAVVRSFEAVPPMSFLPSGPLIDYLIRLVGQMFSLGVQIGFPVTLALLLTHISLGILFRMIPQLNLFVLSFPITISLGLFVLGGTLSLFVAFLGGQMSGLGGSLDRLLLQMQGR